MVTGDIHLPFHCPRTFSHLIEIAEKFGIKKMVSVGDTFELQEFKHYLDNHPGVNWRYEKAKGWAVLELLANQFDEIVLLLGNHELRLWKKLEGAGDQEDVFQIFVKHPNIRYDLYPYCIINDSWFACHPKSYSRIPGRNPYFLASKHMVELVEAGKSPNGQYGLIAFHGHQGGGGRDVSGRFRVADGMGLFDQELFGYAQLKLTPTPNWVKGFFMLRNNYLYPFEEDTTDWDWWLN